jgi:hypothetical protein
MRNGTVGGMYGMAVIGAAVYFVRHAASFGIGLLGLIKAVFWPAVLMYKLLDFLKL